MSNVFAELPDKLLGEVIEVLVSIGDHSLLPTSPGTYEPHWVAVR